MERCIGDIGYIFVPPEVDRQKFIETCYNTTTVSFINEEGQIYNRVPIDKVSIKEIIFPDDIRKLGSPIVWIKVSYKEVPIIIGVYHALDEFQKLEEDQFSLEKITGSGSVKISGKGKTGELFISVNNFSKNTSTSDLQDDQIEDLKSRKQIEGGKVYIDIQNDSSTAELNLNVKGKVNIVTEDTTYIKNAKELIFEVRDEQSDPDNNLKNVTTKLSVKNGYFTFKIVTLDSNGEQVQDGMVSIDYSREVGLVYIDEFKNQILTNKEQVQVLSKKFLLNKGDEAMMLGNSWKKLMDDFIDEVSKITGNVTAVGSPTGPPINIAQLQAFKQKTNDVLSKLGFLESKDSR